MSNLEGVQNYFAIFDVLIGKLPESGTLSTFESLATVHRRTGVGGMWNVTLAFYEQFWCLCWFGRDDIAKIWILSSLAKMMIMAYDDQGCISCGTCSYPKLTEDHVLTSAYVKIFRTVTRNAVNKGVWRKKNCSWRTLNKYAIYV